ncbi:MAG: hypothetical protein ACOYLT_05215 [Flavobacterium sp.]|uniref:hypothetical protein n=1 Tax=Flavobacterium sp. TaxID=239 RepID=UPI003BDFA3B2
MHLFDNNKIGLIFYGTYGDLGKRPIFTLNINLDIDSLNKKLQDLRGVMPTELDDYYFINYFEGNPSFSVVSLVHYILDGLKRPGYIVTSIVISNNYQIRGTDIRILLHELFSGLKSKYFIPIGTHYTIDSNRPINGDLFNDILEKFNNRLLPNNTSNINPVLPSNDKKNNFFSYQNSIDLEEKLDKYNNTQFFKYDKIFLLHNSNVDKLPKTSEFEFSIYEISKPSKYITISITDTKNNPLSHVNLHFKGNNFTDSKMYYSPELIYYIPEDPGFPISITIQREGYREEVILIEEHHLASNHLLKRQIQLVKNNLSTSDKKNNLKIRVVDYQTKKALQNVEISIYKNQSLINSSSIDESREFQFDSIDMGSLHIQLEKSGYHSHQTDLSNISGNFVEYKLKKKSIKLIIPITVIVLVITAGIFIWYYFNTPPPNLDRSEILSITNQLDSIGKLIDKADSKEKLENIHWGSDISLLKIDKKFATVEEINTKITSIDEQYKNKLNKFISPQPPETKEKIPTPDSPKVKEDTKGVVKQDKEKLAVNSWKDLRDKYENVGVPESSQKELQTKIYSFINKNKSVEEEIKKWIKNNKTKKLSKQIKDFLN